MGKAAKRDISDEVRRFLERTRGSYRRFMDAIVGELEDFRDRGRNRDFIYRIYTRADKQVGGDALKSEKGICQKLAKWRREVKSGESQVRVYDVHDIIGVTVVSYFESGQSAIVKALQREDAFKSFKAIHHERKEQAGYYADHIIVEGRGASRSQLRCEIQVKTLLHDGWATKTHDMTYKGPSVPAEIRALSNAIGNIIQNLETQSETLRDVIFRDQEIDRERRDSAVKHLLLVLPQHAVQTKSVEASALFGALSAEMQHFCECNEIDSRLLDLTERWQQAFSAMGGERDLCRFIVALAAMRVDRDLDVRALDAVDAWEERLASSDEADPEAKERALGFRALAHWVLGDSDEAEASGERLIAIQEERGEPSADSYLDLAYFLAERIYTAPPGMELKDLRAKIEHLVAGAPSATSERKRMSNDDSKGAILIMTATSVEAVTSGMALCERAYAWSQANQIDLELFKLFHDLHIQRGRRQMRRLAAD